MTVFIPLVLNPAPKAIGLAGEEYRVTFETGAIGALLAYPTRALAERAEPGAKVVEFQMAEPAP